MNRSGRRRARSCPCLHPSRFLPPNRSLHLHRNLNRSFQTFQVLTELELKDVLAYGLQQTRADLKRIQRLRPPAMYREKHNDILQAVTELELLGRELRLARMQPPQGLLQDRLARIQGRLEEDLLAIDKF